MKLKFLFGVIILVALSNCSGGFSKGVKKDLSTGLTATYNGFSLSEIQLIVDDKKCSNNKIALGKKVIIAGGGVENYTEKNGKAFPGCTIILLDKTGAELLNLPDAFADLKGGLNPKEATTLEASLNTGEPMIVGEKYLLKVRFFDKENKENEIKAQVMLDIVGPAQ